MPRQLLGSSLANVQALVFLGDGVQNQMREAPAAWHTPTFVWLALVDMHQSDPCVQGTRGVSSLGG